jgi:hypothetical protein
VCGPNMQVYAYLTYVQLSGILHESVQDRHVESAGTGSNINDAPAWRPYVNEGMILRVSKFLRPL